MWHGFDLIWGISGVRAGDAGASKKMTWALGSTGATCSPDRPTDRPQIGRDRLQIDPTSPPNPSTCACIGGIKNVSHKI